MTNSTPTPNLPVLFPGTTRPLAVGFIHIPEGNGFILEEVDTGVTYVGAGENATISYDSLLFDPFVARVFVTDENGELTATNRTYQAQGGGIGVSVSLALGTADVQYIANGNRFDGRDLLSGINNVVGSSRNDFLGGNENANDIRGNEGTDTILGFEGNDTIFGGAGADTIDGGSDGDQILGNAGNDIIEGGSGADILVGGSGNDRISGGTGNNLINGASDDLLGNDSTNLGAGEVDILYQSDLDSNGNAIAGTRGDLSGINSYFLASLDSDAYYQGSGDNDRAEVREFDSNDRLVIAAGIDHILTRTEDGFDIATSVNGVTDLVARVTTVGDFDLPDNFEAEGSTITVNLNSLQSAQFFEGGNDVLLGSSGGIGTDRSDVLLSPIQAIPQGTEILLDESNLYSVTGTDEAEIFVVDNDVLTNFGSITNFQDGIDHIDLRQTGISSFDELLVSNFTVNGGSLPPNQTGNVFGPTNNINQASVEVFGAGLTGFQNFLDASDFIFA